jgi:hypothetical protein
LSIGLTTAAKTGRRRRAEIDNDAGILAHDLDGANTFRDEAFKFIVSSLGLDPQQQQPPSSVTAADPVIDSFRVVADRLRAVYTVGERG